MHKVGAQRGGAGKGVDVILAHAHPQRGPVGGPRLGPGGHGHGVAQHQKGAPAQRGVHEVLAQAAEELLDHHDGEEIADDEYPVGQGHGADKGQQHAGDGGGQILVGQGLFHQLPVAPLEQLAGRHGNGCGDQGPGAKEEHRRAQRGHQGDQYVPHEGHGIDGGGHVGRGCHFEPQCLFLTHTFAASFAFCLAAILRSSALAVRKDWTRGMRAGQM